MDGFEILAYILVVIWFLQAPVSYYFLWKIVQELKRIGPWEDNNKKQKEKKK